MIAALPKEEAKPAKPSGAMLALSALGVVFGDLGTSPLYTLQTVVHAAGGQLNGGSALDVLSLIFWTLLIVVSVKYCLFVMRADNQGEGGILSLMVVVGANTLRGRPRLFTMLGVVGAAFIFGDGVITPAISVLSALDGLNVATNAFKPFVMPGAAAVLLALFAVQALGAGKIGAVFGPIMLLWFVVIGALGLRGVILEPKVLSAVNPAHALHFLLSGGGAAPLVLGGVFLCVTGGEALYADMGQFGKGPIRTAWFAIVLPALLLSYAGQTALLLQKGGAHDNQFYQLAPAWALYPLVGLATVAAIIASQAIISGVFSMTRQAVQLGWLPRMTIQQTSSTSYGQVFVPAVNAAMAVATVSITVGFGSADHLAGAYGTAVSATMLVTTALLFLAMKKVWRWPMAVCASLTGLFLVVDAGFFAVNLFKIADGGWLPLSIGALLFGVMTTWRIGIDTISASAKRRGRSLRKFQADLRARPVARVPGVAVFPTRSGRGVPASVVDHVQTMGSLFDRVIILKVEFKERPRVAEPDRVTVSEEGDGLWRVTVRFGFMDATDLPAELRRCVELGAVFDIEEAIYIVSHDRISPSRRTGWLRRLPAQAFDTLERNAQRVEERLSLPAGRVVEIWRDVQA